MLHRWSIEEQNELLRKGQATFDLGKFFWQGCPRSRYCKKATYSITFACYSFFFQDIWLASPIVVGISAMLSSQDSSTIRQLSKKLWIQASSGPCTTVLRRCQRSKFASNLSQTSTCGAGGFSWLHTCGLGRCLEHSRKRWSWKLLCLQCPDGRHMSGFEMLQTSLPADGSTNWIHMPLFVSVGARRTCTWQRITRVPYRAHFYNPHCPSTNSI